MSNQYAIEDVGTMSAGRRQNSPVTDDPNVGPLPGGRASKYGAEPEMRNAVMDYYKADKKQTTANLSTLMKSVSATPARRS